MIRLIEQWHIANTPENAARDIAGSEKLSLL
jgi:hypothetical protein